MFAVTFFIMCTATLLVAAAPRYFNMSWEISGYLFYIGIGGGPLSVSLQFTHTTLRGLQSNKRLVYLVALSMAINASYWVMGSAFS